MFRDVLRFEVDLGDPPIIAGDQAVEDLCQPHTRATVDAPHDAEVDRGDATIAEREQVSVVEIGMEEAVDDRLPQECAHEDGREGLAIVAGRDQRVAIVELDAVEPFEGEDAASRSAPVDLRDIIAGLGDHVFAELGSRRGLALQVEFPGRPLLELGDHEPRA